MGCGRWHNNPVAIVRVTYVLDLPLASGLVVPERVEHRLFGASGHAEKCIANDPRVPKDRVGRIAVAHGAEPVPVRVSRRPASHGITEHAVRIYGGRMTSVSHPRVRPRGRTPVHDVRANAFVGKHATVSCSGPLLFHWVKVRRVGATISVLAATVVTQTVPP